MAIQIIGVNDASPGACVDVGLTWNGSTTLTATQIIAGTAMTMSGTAAITGNTTVGGTFAVTGATTQTGALGCAAAITLGAGADLIGSSTSDITINTNKFTVAGATGNTVIAGTATITGALTQTGAVGLAAAATLGAGADLIGSSTSDITFNTNKFTVAGATGNTVIAGTLTQTGAVAAAASITLGANADLIGSSTSDITCNTNKFTVAGATGNTVIAGTLTQTGVASFAAGASFGGTVVAAANGAYVCPLTTMVTNVSTNNTADLDVSMADGVAGQLKAVILDTDGGKDVVITPDNFGNGTNLTMDTASDYAFFAFDGTEWWAISHSGTVA